MKKKLLVIVWLIAIANIAIAQSSGTGGGILSKLDYGVKLGLNSSRFLVDVDHFTAPKTGFNGGLFVEFRVLDALSVSFEPMFLQQGSNRINPQLFYSELSPLLINLDWTNVRLNSISLPLFINATLPSDGIQPKVFGGVSFDLYKWSYTHNKHTFTVNGIETTSVTQDNITERVNSSGVSGVLGAGVVKKMDPLVLSVDLRYMIGLKNINAVENHPRLSNSTFALTIGIGF